MHNRPLPIAKTKQVTVENSVSKDVFKQAMAKTGNVDSQVIDVTKHFLDLINELTKSAPFLAGHLRLARPEIDYDQNLN